MTQIGLLVSQTSLNDRAALEVQIMPLVTLKFRGAQLELGVKHITLRKTYPVLRSLNIF